MSPVYGHILIHICIKIDFSAGKRRLLIKLGDGSIKGEKSERSELADMRKKTRGGRKVPPFNFPPHMCPINK